MGAFAASAVSADQVVIAFPAGCRLVGHARKTATVIAENDQFTIIIDGETVAAVPRTTTREVHRYKLYAAGNNV